MRIKIDDLPEDRKITKDELIMVFGGVEPTTFPRIIDIPTFYQYNRIGSLPGSMPHPINLISGIPIPIPYTSRGW